MRILSLAAKNFGSYEDIRLDLAGRGLTLVHGPTGSGKSTICDLIPWVLFGKTAKNGAADEIISWGESNTHSFISLETQEGTLFIARTRKPNDLYYSWGESKQIRGKDLLDTQAQINNILGCDASLFISAAYLHEFSAVSQFFTATAKNRRQLCEQMVDLSLPKRLQDTCSTQLLKIKKDKQKCETEAYSLNTRVKDAEQNRERVKNAAISWSVEHEAAIKNAEEKSRSFKEELLSKIASYEEKRNTRLQSLKEKIKNLQETPLVCKSCGSPLSTKEQQELVLTNYAFALSELTDEHISVLNADNPYTHVGNIWIEKLEFLREQTNPHISNLESSIDTHLNIREQLKEIEKTLNSYKTQESDYETLSEILSNFRANLISDAIFFVEDTTNHYLTEYFDGELRVSFSSSDNDKLEIAITKNGNSCEYTQLSKGQRCILKLCFGISVMKAVQNRHGIDINTLFFDEALDGLDDNFKRKAFDLLEAISLDHESVFIVEHSSEFKTLFNNQIKVELINGKSKITQDETFGTQEILASSNA